MDPMNRMISMGGSNNKLDLENLITVSGYSQIKGFTWKAAARATTGLISNLSLGIEFRTSKTLRTANPIIENRKVCNLRSARPK